VAEQVRGIGCGLWPRAHLALQERLQGADDMKVKFGPEPSFGTLRRRDDRGFSSGAGLVAMAVSLLLVALLLVFSMGVFDSGSGSGAAGGGGASASSPIFSRSSAESQIKLCAEGRDSSYGDPPSSAQQAICVRDLLGQVGGASSEPGTP
jgi:hypothetical protein